MIAHSVSSFIAQKYLESYALKGLVLVNPVPPIPEKVVQPLINLYKKCEEKINLIPPANNDEKTSLVTQCYYNLESQRLESVPFQLNFMNSLMEPKAKLSLEGGTYVRTFTLPFSFFWSNFFILIYYVFYALVFVIVAEILSQIVISCIYLLMVVLTYILIMLHFHTLNTGRLPLLIVSTDGDSSITVRAPSTKPSHPHGEILETNFSGDTAILTVETLQSMCEFHRLDPDSVIVLKSPSRAPMIDPNTSSELNKTLFDWIEDRI